MYRKTALKGVGGEKLLTSAPLEMKEVCKAKEKRKLTHTCSVLWWTNFSTMVVEVKKTDSIMHV